MLVITTVMRVNTAYFENILAIASITITQTIVISSLVMRLKVCNDFQHFLCTNMMIFKTILD